MQMNDIYTRNSTLPVLKELVYTNEDVVLAILFYLYLTCIKTLQKGDCIEKHKPRSC